MTTRHDNGSPGPKTFIDGQRTLTVFQIFSKYVHVHVSGVLGGYKPASVLACQSAPRPTLRQQSTAYGTTNNANQIESTHGDSVEVVVRRIVKSLNAEDGMGNLREAKEDTVSQSRKVQT